jgi:hypothetical protein
MAKLTDKDLYEFVYRADTPQKIATAERWLTDHKHVTSQSTFDSLILILNQTAKRLFRASMQEYEERICKNGFEINVRTGEIIACSEG